MADTQQPVYQWRPTGAQANTYFGQLQQQAQPKPQAQPGAPAVPQQPTGFNVPGGSSAGFSSANFQPNDGTPKQAQQPQSFSEALRQNPFSQPLVQSASQAIMSDLGPQQGPSMASMYALNEYNKGESEALRQAKEASALNGRAETGQIGGDVANYVTNKLIPQRQNFLGQLQGQEEQQATQRKQAAVQNLSTLANISQQGEQFQQAQAQTKELALKDLSIREQSLAQDASQFKDQLSFNKWATEQGFSQQEAQRAWQATQNQAQLASQEKLAFADLSVREKQLAQNASQFQDQLSFNKWATQQGFNEQEAQRAWQATQNQAQIASNEKLATADLTFREQQLAQNAGQFKDELAFKKWAAQAGFADNEAQRAWQATQNEKQIASQEKVSFAGLNLQQQQMAQQAMQFQSKLDFDKWATQAGLSQQDKELVWKASEAEKDRQLTAGQGELNRTLQKYIADQGFNIDSQKVAEQVRQFDSQQAFQKWATQAGLDADSAKLVWQANQNDIDRKQQLGMQLTANEQQINLANLQNKFDTAAAERDHLLNLDTMEKQQANAVALKNMDQTFAGLMQERGFTQTQALEATKQEYAKELAKMGYDQATALQAADLQAKAFQAEQDRNLASLQTQAELAYKYNALTQEAGLTREQIAQRREEAQGQLSLGLQQLGLDQKKIDAAISSQQFQDRSGALATFMEMAGDDPVAVDHATISYLQFLGDPNLPGGALLTPEQVQAGIASIKGGALEREKQTAADQASAEVSQQDLTAAKSDSKKAGSFNTRLVDPLGVTESAYKKLRSLF